MKVTLVKLTLHNFKGISDLMIESRGDVFAFGRNGAGKTTLPDAFWFLLFGKDSMNRAQFDIKPMDANRQTKKGLNPEVEATLLLDDKPLTLKRQYAEKWTKPRGKSRDELTGHETFFWVDGVPVSKSEFERAVSRIADEELFKLLTNPAYFCSVMKWQDRRRILFDACGDLSDDDVIASNRKLADLPKFLNGRSLDDTKKILLAQRTKVNKEIENLPVRIDEANRHMPDVEGLDEAILDTEIQSLRVTIEQQSAELVKSQNGVREAELQKQIAQIDGEIITLESADRASSIVDTTEESKRVRDARKELSDLEDSMAHERTKLERLTRKLEDEKAEVSALREKWAVITTEQPDIHTEGRCTSCKQDLPAEQVQAAHDNAVAEFNRSKSDRLEKVVSQGNTAKAEVERLELEISRINEYLSVGAEEVTKAKAELISAESALKAKEGSVPTEIAQNPEITVKKSARMILAAELETLRQSSKDAIDKIQLGIVALRAQLASKEQEKVRFAQVTALQERINTLQQQEKDLARELESIDHQLHLIEEFTRTKVSILTDHINSKFKLTKWELFQENITNDGLKEMCEATHDGVLYNGGLNTAMRVNVGIDVINVLSQHYNLYLPIFVDGRESVTDLLDTKSQVWSLVVSPQDKKLRIETSVSQPVGLAI